MPSPARQVFERILVIVADDEASAAAVRVAADLAARVDGEVLAVQVSRRDIPCRGPSAAECGLGEDDAGLARALDLLREAGVRHRGERWQVLDDRVLASVSRAVEEHDPSVVIVGGGPRAGLLARLRPGLGHRLAARATRPVLLVPRT